jgi:hypothetical protein
MVMRWLIAFSNRGREELRVAALFAQERYWAAPEKQRLL